MSWDYSTYMRFKDKSRKEKCKRICQMLGISESYLVNNQAGGFTSDGLTQVIVELEKKLDGDGDV